MENGERVVIWRIGELKDKKNWQQRWGREDTNVGEERVVRVVIGGWSEEANDTKNRERKEIQRIGKSKRYEGWGRGRDTEDRVE